MTAGRTKWTPPEIARRWGISPEKVVGWIRSGELKAMNAATRIGGRPRYLIDARDLEAFELRRSVAPKQPVRRQQHSSSGVTSYY